MENNQNRPKLLEEFSVPAYEQWLELVNKQLKGAPFEKKLITSTEEGVKIQPIYQRKDALDESVPLPGEFPYIRGTKASGLVSQGWKISQEFLYSDATEWNQAVSSDITKGLSAVIITLDDAGKTGNDPDQSVEGTVGKNGLSLFNHQEFATALKKLDLTSLTLFGKPGEAILPFFSLLLSSVQNGDADPQTLKGAMVADPFSQLATKGSLTRTMEQVLDEIAGCTDWVAKKGIAFKTIGLDLSPYAESGASSAQELGIALASGLEMFREMQNRTLSIDEVGKNICFFIGLGPDFFRNIAKLRALRALWAKVVSACGGTETTQKTELYAGTLHYNKTTTDPYVNLLRTTSEAYSGILGGCDALSIAGFDSVFGLPDEFSRRISRNIQYILKEECHGQKVIDPAGGSWFVEQLTDQLSEKAWGFFQEIEAKGGIKKALEAGFIQESIREVAEKKSKETAIRKNVIVGTNMFPNLEEQKPEVRLPDYQALSSNRSQQSSQYKAEREESDEFKNQLSEKASAEWVDVAVKLAQKGATLGELASLKSSGKEELKVKALGIHRVSDDYEALRSKADLFKEKNGEYPQIFLANMGTLKEYKARADYSTGFLEPGGFKVLSDKGFTEVDAAVNSALDSGAKIVVICSTDDNYPDLVPALVEKLKQASSEITIALAGYPKDHVEAFTKAGVDEYIHLKANNLQLLQNFQEKAGV